MKYQTADIVHRAGKFAPAHTSTQSSGSGSDSRQPTDSDIAAAASCAIWWITTIPPEDVHITVHDGCLTLEGALDSWHQSQTLENLLRHLTGVKAVTNLIRTKA